MRERALAEAEHDLRAIGARFMNPPNAGDAS
jgi:hypothetical protein